MIKNFGNNVLSEKVYCMIKYVILFCYYKNKYTESSYSNPKSI